MSNLTARDRDGHSTRPRLTAVKWSVPSTEPDTSAVDGSWLEATPRHSFIAYRRSADANTSTAPGRETAHALPSEIAYDVWESPHALVVLVDLPGVGPGQIALSLGSHALYLKVSAAVVGELDAELTAAQHDVRVELPSGVGPDAIDASLSHGLLRIRISKATAGARRVTIVSDESDE